MRGLCITTALLLAASPVDAWEHGKGQNTASATETAAGIRVSFSCQQGRNDLGFSIGAVSGDDAIDDLRFARARNLMIWIRLPDRRTIKWSFAASPEGPHLTGVIAMSSYNLDFFGNAEHMEIEDNNTNDVLFTSDMKGTGAARIAFRERCGI